MMLPPPPSPLPIFVFVILFCLFLKLQYKEIWTQHVCRQKPGSNTQLLSSSAALHCSLLLCPVGLGFQLINLKTDHKGNKGKLSCYTNGWGRTLTACVVTDHLTESAQHLLGERMEHWLRVGSAAAWLVASNAISYWVLVLPNAFFEENLQQYKLEVLASASLCLKQNRRL